MAAIREPRAGERGLTLIEALIIVSITAMLALLLLPMVSSAAGRNFGRADQAIESARAAQAERDFRVLLNSLTIAHGQGLEGGALGLGFHAGPEFAAGCVTPGAPAAVRLTIVNAADGGGRLWCEAQGRQVEVLAWSEGQARFVYGGEGGAWAGAWSEPARAVGAMAPTRSAPLVRFELSSAGGRNLAWIAQAGWTEPAPLESGSVQ
jgi:type II secretory pathway pseudopilin PulG